MSAIGLRVGSYEIIGPTTVPEPGAWHHARRIGTSRRGPSEVLVRLLPPDATSDDRAALHHQYEVLRALEDPRVPEAVDFYEGLGAMSMAFVKGTSLAELVDRRADEGIDISPGTLIDILLELGETLQRAHHRNRFHGDLSPDRILLGRDGRLWVFGFGAPLGSVPHPSWIAPEVAAGLPPDARTDQWYLGVLAAGLVAGGPARSPEGADALEPLLHAVDQQWPSLGHLVRRMTAPQPHARYATMHPVRQELLALAKDIGGRSLRRELGASLARPRPEGPPADVPVATPDAPEPPPEAPESSTPDPADAAPAPEPTASHDSPGDDAGPEATDPTDDGPAETPSVPEATEAPPAEVSPPAVRRAVEQDAFVVVQPDVTSEVPIAEVHHEATPPPAPSREPVTPSAPPASASTGAAVPTGQPANSEVEGQDEPLLAGVSYEPSDPHVDDRPAEDALPPLPSPDAAMQDIPSSAFPSVPSSLEDEPSVEPNPFSTELGAQLAADAERASETGEGKTWDDLARGFFGDPASRPNETLLPPDGPPSAAPEDAPDPVAVRSPEEPGLGSVSAAVDPAGPGSDASLGIGAVPPEASVQSLSTPTPEKRPQAVPTDALVTRIAPLALAGFGFVFLLALAALLFG